MPGTARNPEASSLDLPDLDKADDGQEVDVGVFELDMGEELDLEDGEGAVDPFEIGIQEQDAPGSDEPASELEIGMADLLDALPDEPATRDSDAPPAVDGERELDLHLDTPLETDDPSTDAELGDDGLEDLPELVPDEVDSPDLERPFLPGAPEGRIPVAARLEPEWLALGSPCSALWHGGGHTLASADHLMWFGAERKSHALPVGTLASALCIDGAGNAVLASTRGLLEVTPSGGTTQLEPPEQMRGSGAELVELAATPGSDTLWARLSNGVLLRRRRGVWERHETGGSVQCLSCQAPHMALLVVSARPTLQLSNDGGSSFRELILPEPAATVALGTAPHALVRGALIAIADAERGLCVSSDAGETFLMVVGAVNVTAAVLGDWQGEPRLLAALYRESRDLSELIVVNPASAAAESVAELSGQPDEDAEESGNTRALILADGYLWAAGGYGLARLKA